MRRLATKYRRREPFGVLIAAAMNYGAQCSAADPKPLVLAAKICLGNGHGRIDHLAADVDRQRLHAAELGNQGIAVIDLMAHIVISSGAASIFYRATSRGRTPSTHALSRGNGCV